MFILQAFPVWDNYELTRALSVTKAVDMIKNIACPDPSWEEARGNAFCKRNHYLALLDIDPSILCSLSTRATFFRPFKEV